jgi:hypothetical protein
MSVNCDLDAIRARIEEHHGREDESISGRIHRSLVADVEALIAEVERLREQVADMVSVAEDREFPR